MQPIHFSIFRKEPVRGLTVLELIDFFERYSLFQEKQAADFYTMVVVTKGELLVTIEGKSHTVGIGSILFASPNQPIMIQNVDADGFLLSFFEDFYTHEYSITRLVTVFRPLATNSARIVNLQKPVFEDLSETFDLILKKVRKASPISPHQPLNSLLNAVFTTLSHLPEFGRGFAEALDYNLLEKFVSLVEAHYFSEQNPNYYAKAIGITQEKLNQLSNKHFGLSTKKFIMKKVMLEVRNLLSGTNMQIAEIAYALNFSDNSYFNKVFVKYHRMTPGKYRKLHKTHN